MKLTKKAAALLLAASLAVSVCAMPVFAAEMGSQEGSTTGTEGTDTQVLYTVTKRYTWTLPTTIDFGVNAGVQNTSTVEANLDGSETGEQAKKESTGTKWKGTAPKVCVTENVIGTGETLKIQLKAKDGTEFKVENESNTALTYKVKTTAETINGTVTTPYAEKIVDAASGTDILALKAGKNTGDVALEFVLTTANTKAEIAGEYKDTVTFTARIE